MPRRLVKHIRPLVLFALVMSALVSSQGQKPSWTEPFPPHRIIGNLYYVGSKDLASFLVVTPQGNILINSNLESSVPQIRRSIEKLGFKYSDTKILLISHAHFDHAAGSATILKETGAKYMVMDDDVPAVEDGGKSDFNYGSQKSSWFKPAKVDRTLHDGDTVTLGDMTLVAHKTPGHTKGCTTWSMAVKLGNHSLEAVIVGSPNVNPGYRLVNNAKYPEISQNFEYTFNVLKALRCDIFLGAHGEYYGLIEKYALLEKGYEGAFLDPSGYRQFVADRENRFREELTRQQDALK